MFVNESTGTLIPISGEDSRGRPWSTVAFVPVPLPATTPQLTTRTHAAVGRARAALAALDSSATRLADPALLRRPTLRIEAQSTSALEGTYAPLETVLSVNEDEVGGNAALREVLNYVAVAEDALAWTTSGRPITVSLLEDLQGRLVRGTGAHTDQAGRIRTGQVMIGAGVAIPVNEARFVPAPPGPSLEASVRDLVNWVNSNDRIEDADPLIEIGMAHYQFEALHPFNDGNGRIGRLLIVLHLLLKGVLAEPTLTVSPWFESRRLQYYDRLFRVSTHGDWDGWLSFFADGVRAAADSTSRRLSAVISAQLELKTRVRQAGLRAETAVRAVDFATSNPIFTTRQLEHSIGVSYGRANRLIQQLIGCDVLRQRQGDVYDRRFYAPAILSILTDPENAGRPAGNL